MRMLRWSGIGLAAVAGATACGGDDSSNADGGDVGSVMYETCPTECPSPPTCDEEAGEILTCCVCVARPGREAGRTQCGIMSEYCDETPIDPVNVTCLKPEGWPDPPPPVPPTVTVRGVVDVYGNGNPALGGDITVEFFTMQADGSPSADPVAATTATLAACNESLLPPILEDDLEAECCPGACKELMPDVHACSPISGDCRPLWFYEASDIPTSTPLIVRTSGNPVFWKDMYFYNTFFLEEDVEPGETYVHHRLKTLALEDWDAIPATAGDFSGIAPGMGAVAGEIHDCDNIKLYNATVGTQPEAVTDTYFNGIEEKPYPEAGRGSTNYDSIYAAMEIAPGPVRVTALALVAGEGIVNLGWFDARIIPGALTVVTIRGTRPTQVPVP